MLIRALKRFIWLAGVLFLAKTAAILWLESPLGAKTVSWLATGWVESKIPGTRLTCGNVHVLGFLQVELIAVRWEEDMALVPIFHVDRLILSVGRPALLFRNVTWSVRSELERLNLEALDRIFVEGELKAKGSLVGPMVISGTGSRIDGFSIRWEALAPGGALASEWLERLLVLMPEGDSRAQLLKALEQHAAFRFKVCRLMVDPEGDSYRVNLLLDGDHLLDLTLRIPKDNVALLSQWMAS